MNVLRQSRPLGRKLVRTCLSASTAATAGLSRATDHALACDRWIVRWVPSIS